MGTVSHDGVVLQAITVPRAPSPEGRCYLPLSTGFEPVSPGVTPALSLILAHAPDLNPLTASVLPLYRESLQVAAPPAGSRPFPTLFLRIFLYVQGPLPRLLLWCAHPFLPTRLRPSRRCHPVGALHGNPCFSNFSMGDLSRLQSFVNLQARRFARHPDSLPP